MLSAVTTVFDEELKFCRCQITNLKCFPAGQCVVPMGGTAPVCQCDHGFDGLACDRCLAKFTGTSCERCETNYIGYNTTCTTYCVHGYATLLGKNHTIKLHIKKFSFVI